MPAHTGGLVQGPETSLDPARPAEKQRIRVGNRHQVPLLLEHAPGGAHHDRCLLSLASPRRPQPYLDTEGLLQFPAHPLDREAGGAEAIRTAIRTLLGDQLCTPASRAEEGAGCASWP